MDDLSLITLGPTDPSIKPNTFPEATIVWEPNADRTHANGHLEYPAPPPPPVPPTLGDITAVVDDVAYTEGTTSEIDEDQALMLAVFLEDMEDEASPTFEWDVRKGTARLSPNGPACGVFNQTLNGNPLQVQCNIRDDNCSDSPKSFRFSFFVTP